MNKDGGPAFPEVFSTFSAERDTLTDVYSAGGMSLRDYFAAHAPAEHWSCFQAVVPPKPTRPQDQPVGNDGEWPTELESRMLAGWRTDAYWDAHEELPKFSHWIRSWEVYWKALGEWNVACVRAAYEQWPWYYAAAMLKAREQ